MKRIKGIITATIVLVSFLIVINPVSSQQPTEVWVDDDFTGSEDATHFDTIQEGIDAVAPGGTVHVAAGTYDEQLIIDKNLTIQGAGDTTTIKPSQATANNFQIFSRKAGGSDNTAAIVVANADATIKNLKIDGSEISSVPSGATLVGILYRGVNGTIDSVTVDNINISSGIGGNAIYLSSMDKVVNVEVKGCTILNFYKNGITANYEGLTVNIHDNTVTGMGATGTITQNGIQIGYGATGTVKNNIVSSHIYTGSGWAATGILFYDANGSAEGNTLTYNQIGLSAQTSASGTYTISVKDNDIDGSGLSSLSFAMGVMGIEVLSYGAPISIVIDGNDIRNYNLTYGSGYYAAAIQTYQYLGTISAEIKNNDIQNSYYGIENVGADINITYNNITTCLYGIVDYYGDSTIHYNNIYGNTYYGIYSAAAVDAENNWWGANDGPGGVGPGSGDAVSDNVDYDPWIQFGLAADPNQLVVGENSTLTARLQNSDGEVPSGIDQLPLKKVTFETDLGAVGSTTVTKDLEQGQATATLTSTTSGTAHVTAQAKDAEGNAITGASAATNVVFLAGPPGTIDLAADPLNIVADGSSTSAITVIVKDRFGNLVADGTQVSFSTDLGTLGSSQVTKTTADGVAQAPLTAGVEPGVATIEVQAGAITEHIAVFLKAPGGVDVEAAKSEQTEPGDDTVDAKDEAGVEVDKSGPGTPVVTAARYADNPGGPPAFSPFEGSYFDVHLDDAAGVDEIVIRFYYPKDVDEEKLVLYWWDGSYWQICSDQWKDTADTDGYGGYIAARITASSVPSLADLGGAPFGVGGAGEALLRHRYSRHEVTGWRLISFPIAPEPTDPVAQLEDDLGPVGIYTWDAALGEYVYPAQLELGQAYWVWLEDQETVIDVTGHKLFTSPQEIACAEAGWHMVGPAFFRTPGDIVRWGSDVWVRHAGEVATGVEAAAERGWIKPFVIRYDPDTDPRYCYWVGYGEAVLVPWEGYWVRTLVPDVTLLFHFIPAPPGSALGDVGAMGFRPAPAGMELPPPPPAWTPQATGWWVAVSTTPTGACFQVVGPLSPKVEAVRLQVFDLAGRRVYQGQAIGPELLWPYSTESGVPVANGVYLARVSANIDGAWQPGELLELFVLR